MEEGRPYFILSQNSPLTLTLSDEDNRSVLGNELNERDNQKWIATRGGDGWTLENVASGKFLGIAYYPIPGAKVIAANSPTSWILIPGPDGPSSLSITVPDSPLNVSLPNDGRVPPGTPVVLQDGSLQAWMCEPAEPF